jgi:uncharacterized protein (TIRG00374 family)
MGFAFFRDSRVNSSMWSTLLKYGVGLAILALVLWLNWEPTPASTSAQLVGGGLLASPLSTPGLGEMIRRPIHLLPFVIALAISATGLLLTFLRWHLLVRAQGLEFSRYSAIRLGLVGYFFNTFLPGSVGGDILKAYGIARDQSRRTVAVATVLIDRAIGLWGVLWMVALIGGFFTLTDNPILRQNAYLQWIVRFSALVVLGSVVAWVLLSFLSERRADRFAARLEGIPKIGHMSGEFWRAVWMYQKQRNVVVAALLLSVVGHLGWVLVFHTSTRVFDIPNPEATLGTLEEHFMIAPVANTAQALFPTPGGVGGGEAMFGWLYQRLGKPSVNGVLGCLAQRLVFLLLGVMGYIVYARMRVPGGPVESAERNGAG